MPQAPISRPPRDQARLVIALVAGLVVLGLVLAVLGIRGLTSSAPLVRSGPASRAPSSAPASPTAASGAAPSASTAASPSPTGSTSPSASPATISGIGTIDPQGDGTENNGSAPNAIDGDQSTTWRSNRYASADFGGLKHGVGLYLRLSGGTVTSVTVSMPGTGGTVELRTATGPGLDGSEVVATATASGGTAVLKPTTPVTAEQLLLWFTSLPQQSNGEYRLVVSEISVS